ncbi:MAG: SDR family oxidoreductase [Rhodospirillales bacterium]|nr:SDR family oxidoreductase [Rhodospirillales bacterium]
MSGALDGKVAIVTGGGTGIGEAIVRRFAAEGAKVVVAGRRKNLVDKIAAEVGGLAVAADVTREADLAALAQACDRAYGRLDVLVANAGIAIPAMPIEDFDLDAWDKVFAVNTRGALLSIKYAMPLLKRQGGSIITIASGAVFRPKAQRAAYAASKIALVGLTKAVAQEGWPFGIRVNALAPGNVDTVMLRGSCADLAKARGVSIDVIEREARDVKALRRLATVEQIAGTAVFLASARSSAITGELVLADSGEQ